MGRRLWPVAGPGRLAVWALSGCQSLVAAGFLLGRRSSRCRSVVYDGVHVADFPLTLAAVRVGAALVREGRCPSATGATTWRISNVSPQVSGEMRSGGLGG
jgi:hypothetical protein